MEEAFKVIEPSGKIYRIYADGRVEGFAGGSMIFNRIPSLEHQARAEGRADPATALTPSPIGPGFLSP